MGLSYPSDARLVNAAPPPTSPPGNAAVVRAARAFEAALVAAIRSAAADEAVRRLDAEIATTRGRVRALEKRWLPLLQEALAQVELSLEQAEQEEGSRLRRAAAASPDRRSLP
jgi:V/A-type H+-transporting ATPase subunit D